MKGEPNETTVALAAAQMAEKLNHDPVLCEQLIPKWEIGCRRVTPGPGYLESFSKPNCSLTSSPITKITENGIVTADGKVFECDVCKFIPWPTVQAISNTVSQWFALLALMSLSALNILLSVKMESTSLKNGKMSLPLTSR